MLLTDCGIDQIEHWRNRIANRFSEIMLGRPIESNQSYQAMGDWTESEPVFRAPDRTPDADLLRFRSQIRSTGTDVDLAGHEQRARVLALRGLSQARDGEYERAQTTFASAARLDPRLDLALLPSFWNLPRRAHEAAVAALHEADRGRDAAALTATIRMRFRPQALRGMKQANSGSFGRNEQE